MTQVAQLSSEQFTRLWQQVIGACAECLLQADGDPESSIGKRLVRFQGSRFFSHEQRHRVTRRAPDGVAAVLWDATPGPTLSLALSAILCGPSSTVITLSVSLNALFTAEGGRCIHIGC